MFSSEKLIVDWKWKSRTPDFLFYNISHICPESSFLALSRAMNSLSMWLALILPAVRGNNISNKIYLIKSRLTHTHYTVTSGLTETAADFPGNALLQYFTPK